eukprot:1300171-Amorphochlora_amoeboformis.AAC.1
MDSLRPRNPSSSRSKSYVSIHALESPPPLRLAIFSPAIVKTRVRNSDTCPELVSRTQTRVPVTDTCLSEFQTRVQA